MVTLITTYENGIEVIHEVLIWISEIIDSDSTCDIYHQYVLLKSNAKIY